MVVVVVVVVMGSGAAACWLVSASLARVADRENARRCGSRIPSSTAERATAKGLVPAERVMGIPGFSRGGWN
eukprot:4383120-Pyramimonas_sp.AAC.1